MVVCIDVRLAIFFPSPAFGLQPPLVGNEAPDFMAQAVFDQEFVEVTLSQYRVSADWQNLNKLLPALCMCCWGCMHAFVLVRTLQRLDVHSQTLLIPGSIRAGAHPRRAVHSCGSTSTSAGRGPPSTALPLQGKYVVLFFYPLDFTFVCPTEITAFSDRHGDFEKVNAEVGLDCSMVYCLLYCLQGQLLLYI